LSLDHAILGFLAERERSGYDLKTRCFDTEARSWWTADQAQIYRTLERLKGAGLVRVRRRRQSGRPDRKLFSITDAGLAELHRWLASPEPLPSPREAFLLHLYFGAGLADAELLGVLRARRAGHQERLDSLRVQASEALGSAGSGRDRPLRSMALDGSIVEQRAAIDWLDDCIEMVEAGSLPAPARRTLPSEGA
jgi:DNA-binding PadR family transcriptional regulator